MSVEFVEFDMASLPDLPDPAPGRHQQKKRPRGRERLQSQQQQPDRQYNKHDLHLAVCFLDKVIIDGEEIEITKDEKALLHVYCVHAQPDGTGIYLSNPEAAKESRMGLTHLKEVKASILLKRVLLSDGRHGYYPKYKLHLPGATPQYDASNIVEMPPVAKKRSRPEPKDEMELYYEHKRQEIERIQQEQLKQIAADEEFVEDLRQTFAEDTAAAVKAADQPLALQQPADSQQLPQTVYNNDEINSKDRNTDLEEPTFEEMNAWAAHVKEIQLLDTRNAAAEYARTYYLFDEASVHAILADDPANFNLNADYYHGLRIKKNQLKGQKVALLQALGRQFKLSPKQMREILTRPVEEWSFSKYLPPEEPGEALPVQEPQPQPQPQPQPAEPVY